MTSPRSEVQTEDAIAKAIKAQTVALRAQTAAFERMAGSLERLADLIERTTTPLYGPHKDARAVQVVNIPD